MARLLSAAGADMARMKADGVLPRDFAYEDFARANLVGRRLRVEIEYTRGSDGKEYPDVTPILSLALHGETLMRRKSRVPGCIFSNTAELTGQYQEFARGHYVCVKGGARPWRGAGGAIPHRSWTQASVVSVARERSVGDAGSGGIELRRLRRGAPSHGRRRSRPSVVRAPGP